MITLLKILEEIGVESASSTYGNFQPEGESIPVKEHHHVDFKDSGIGGGDLSLEKIPEKFTCTPTKIYFTAKDNNQYYVDVKNSEISIGMYPVANKDGVERVKNIISEYKDAGWKFVE